MDAQLTSSGLSNGYSQASDELQVGVAPQALLLYTGFRNWVTHHDATKDLENAGVLSAG